MASPSSVLSEEQFLCSICLDTFTSPVSTPCGHSFCLACIGGYWDSSDVCQCPLCKETFYRRPDLRVNRSLAEITEQFKRTRVSSDEGLSSKPGEVSCDICTGRKLNAVKSCLMCLMSYCSVHIQPHYDLVKLKKHRLIEPVESLEDRLCEKHERLLELFCRTDQTCVCVLCTEIDHKTHSTVPLEQECRVKKVGLWETRLQQECALSSLTSFSLFAEFERLRKHAGESVVTDRNLSFTKVTAGSQGSIQALTLTGGDVVTPAFKPDITLLLQYLESLTGGQCYFHTTVTDTSSHTPGVWNLNSVAENTFLLQFNTYSHDQLHHSLSKSVIYFHLREESTADVTLDPNTAHPNLILSEDGKQVRHGDTRQDLPDNPERFDTFVSVLGKDGITSGRHYWEVEVGEKSGWDLGITRESRNRKGRITVSPQYGYWAVCLRNGNEYFSALTDPETDLPFSLRPRRLGVCVDIEDRKVSFYTVESRTHIHTFTDMVFNQGEKIYPVFWTWDSDKNLVLLPAVSCGD
uniref:Uncharacterized protein n=1 Tax=Lepisosteus oculatus TaxID=7918 RepID=W5LZE5_LEPOC